ncbi:MAG: hypothetical protein M3220_16615 [Chloroflexota bacterium]|nr:hypothetical protein [Chloroflexota bacterium]
MIGHPKQTALPPGTAEPLGRERAQRSKARKTVTKVVGIVGGVLVGVVALGWAGLRVQPAPFPAVAGPATPPETIPLPAGLPAPVERFYRQTYGDQVPVIHTAVISGRGTMAPFGIALPVRFRFTHEAGSNYRHYIETTFFGIPFMKINEYYVDGKERMEMPWGVSENNPKLDQGGNLGMWAEAVQWMPALLLTDPNVRWEAVDDTTAWLVVPFGESEERFLTRFDETSGELLYAEAMRYKSGVGDKTLWINGIWFDEGKPWFVVTDDNVVYNVDVDVSLSARGQHY